MQTRFDRQERLHQAIRLVRRIDLDVGRVMQSDLRGSGLTPASHAVLETLVEHGARTVPEMAARLGLKRQFAQRAMSGLIRSGLVEMLANPHHKRSYLCGATQQGRAIFEAVRQRELALLHRHLGDINTTEVIVALRVLNRVADCFSDVAGRRAAAGQPEQGSAAADAGR